MQGIAFGASGCAVFGSSFCGGVGGGPALLVPGGCVVPMTDVGTAGGVRGRLGAPAVPPLLGSVQPRSIH